jgi:uncharacterized protein YcfJ
MKKTNQLITLLTVVTLSSMVNIAQAKHQNNEINNTVFYATAKVLNIEPIVKNIEVSTPKRECWEEEVSRPEYTTYKNNTGNVIFSGLVGGIVGNQFGHGRGKTAATVVGSIIGAAIGNDITKNDRYVTRTERVDYEHHCRVTQTSYTEERIEGYWVTYRYKGEIFTSRMNEEPGKRLRVKIQVTPELH